MSKKHWTATRVKNNLGVAFTAAQKGPVIIHRKPGGGGGEQLFALMTLDGMMKMLKLTPADRIRFAKGLGATIVDAPVKS